MKAKILLLLFVASIALSLSSCVTTMRAKPIPRKEKRIPPGHMKKIMGSKSAKQYAPGHRK